MSHEDDGKPIVGRSVEDAVDEIVSRDDAYDPDVVRATLDRVATDDVVSHDAVSEALGDASMAVSTAETRTELAGIALSDARDEAESVSDLDTVAARLDAFESRVESVENRATLLGTDLERLVERAGEDGAVFSVATGIRRLASNAEQVQRAADELKLDLESFEEWATDSETRVRELEADADAVEQSLGDLAAAIDEMAAAVERDAPESGAEPTQTGATWADVRLRHRVMALLLADVRAELADLRTWSEREGTDAEGRRADLDDSLADLDERLDVLGARLDDLDVRLADLARPEWTDRFGEQVAAFETATDGFEPPLDWAEVEATFGEHRPEPERDGSHETGDSGRR
ncbi:halo transducer protein [Halorussus amylolyticus]|uniref:halo transducer protein n=1 Tax=Halorussus amylolyticus TaxID=1126242 RepID=UPI0010534FBB|nr:halo transducer protein [Halorussus amylolyticus]